MVIGGKRLYYIDSLKGIAIFLVVLGHASLGNNGLCYWVSSIHLPLFFIISGMMMRYRDSWKEHNIFCLIEKRAKQLLYPYVTFSVLAILSLVIRGNPYDAIKAFLHTIILDGYSTLWFLPALFFAEIFFVCMYKRKIETITIPFCVIITAIIGKVLNIIAVQNIWAKGIYILINIINRAVTASVYIYIGYIFFCYADKIIQKYKKNIIISICLFVIVINVFLCQRNGLVDLHYSKFNNIFLYYFCAISSSLAIIMIIKILNQRNICLEFLGKNSLVIMATHTPLPIMILARKIKGNIPMELPLYFQYLLVAILVMVIESVVIYFINHYMPFLLRRK